MWTTHTNNLQIINKKKSDGILFELINHLQFLKPISFMLQKVSTWSVLRGIIIYKKQCFSE